jgi:protein SCO1
MRCLAAAVWCRPAVAIAAALAAILGAGLSPTVEAEAAAPAAHGPAIPGITSRFVLETAAGGSVTQASFPGKWLVVYFGYTQCPDACPTALSAIAGALEKLGPLADRVQPLFITVDPERDTPQIIADYVKAFGSRLVGLHGSEAEIAAAAKAFHVYYAVRNLGHGEYAIDHSSFVYVVDPDGRVVELLTGNLPAPAMAAALRQLLE